MRANDRETPLALSCRGGRTDVTKLLLRHPLIDVNKGYITPLNGISKEQQGIVSMREMGGCGIFNEKVLMFVCQKILLHGM